MLQRPYVIKIYRYKQNGTTCINKRPYIMKYLKKLIQKIDQRGYKAYQQLRGSYDFEDFTLYLDHIQGDPFAAPSKLRARVMQEKAKFSPGLFNTKPRRIALQDYITRAFSQAINNLSLSKTGSGKSGLLHIDCGRQHILERTSCTVNQKLVEVCFYAGLPARGRRIMGRECETLLMEKIPKIISLSLFYSALNKDDCINYIQVCEDQVYLRKQLPNHNLVAFIANGSILPRRSGVSDKPLSLEDAVPFKSPPQLEIELTAPHKGKVKGMGIPPGITLIIGGGFHGKTTLLEAVKQGVYNHVPQDGREYVIALKNAVKIRAEEGRSIQKVDISPFINNLPRGKNTQKFSTPNASGSTSQAANIMEALELGTDLLLIDEDTSATNFLIRDPIMQKIVPNNKEPITPFIDQVKNLFKQYKTSILMVMGGCSDYFEVADQVIMMDTYLPALVTNQAKQMIKNKKDKRNNEIPGCFGAITERIPLPESINPYRGNKKKIKSRGISQITFGLEDIDLSALEQIVDSSQVNAISEIIYYALKNKYIDGSLTLSQCLDKVISDISTGGLKVISPFASKHPGSFALPRKIEIGAAINRLRSLKVVQKKP